MPTRILLIGLDGADPDLMQSWMDKGLLPNLKSIAENGVFSALTSTVPPFTYPAWSSLLTGVNPGKHGIIDFTRRIPGSYSVRFINATHRRRPTIFNRLSRNGLTVGAMGFPTMYPPETVNGWVISGFDSPVAVTADASFCNPRSLFRELKKRITPYSLTGIQELRIGRHWHEKALTRMIRNIEDRTAIAEYLLGKTTPDVAGIVFSESDTVSHHFWSAFDKNSPRHIPGRIRSDHAIGDVYAALDAAIGRLRDYLGRDGHLLIVSDHGFQGTGARSVSINRMLENAGFLRFQDQKTGKFWPFVSRTAVRAIPAALQERIFRISPNSIPARIESGSRLAGIDLPRSRAFSEDLNYFPSVWLHDERFPHGFHFAPGERETTLQRITNALLSMHDPKHDRPIIRRIFNREDIYSGEAVSGFPDLILELNTDAGYAYPISRTVHSGDIITPLPESEMTGRKGGSMNGSHRESGVFLAYGPEIRPGAIPRDPVIMDIFPTVMHLAGQPPVPDTDGRILREIFTGDTGNRQPEPAEVPDITAATDPPAEYAPEQANEIRKRLENLGYL